MITVNGVRYVSATDVQEEFGDVNAARLRDWRRRRLLVPVTRAELAAALGVPVPDRPHDPAVMLHPGSRRREVLLRWTSVVDAEVHTGTAQTGRRRTIAA